MLCLNRLVYHEMCDCGCHNGRRSQAGPSTNKKAKVAHDFEADFA